MPERHLRKRDLHDQLVRTGSACPERAGLDQKTPKGLRPSQQMCARCGRVTARRDETGLSWCGGEPVTVEQRTAEVAPGTWASSAGPAVAS